MAPSSDARATLPSIPISKAMGGTTMTEHVDALIDSAHEVAAAVGDRTLFGRVYQALVAERQKVLAVQKLVQDADGEWLDRDAFDGLAGRIQDAVAMHDRVDTP